MATTQTGMCMRACVRHLTVCCVELVFVSWFSDMFPPRRSMLKRFAAAGNTLGHQLLLSPFLAGQAATQIHTHNCKHSESEPRPSISGLAACACAGATFGTSLVELGQAVGLAPLADVAMPANNRLLVLTRTDNG